MKIIENYHSHTTFDKHASETPEEVIIKAIEYGFEIFGFSAHVPLPYDDGSNRMSTIKELESYINEVTRIKEKYKEKIKVEIGMEFDLINRCAPKESMKDWLLKIEGYKEIDYVIVGHHYLPNDYKKESWMTYISKLEEFIKYSNKFKYLGHPDIFMNKFKKETSLSKWISKEIINLSIKYNFPLGINIIGIYENKSYPSKPFFKMASELGASTIFEMDNHYKEIWKQSTFDKAFAFIEECSLNPINLKK